MNQKRPDVHKIVLSIKLRSPPPRKSVNFEDLVCTVFPHFGPFPGGGGGGKTKFCRQEFYGHPNFSALWRELSGPAAILSYRAMLIATVSQNSSVLVFVWYRTIIARCVATWGIAEMCLFETRYQWGVSHHNWGAQAFLETSREIWCIATIVSQYRAIWGH